MSFKMQLLTLIMSFSITLQAQESEYSLATPGVPYFTATARLPADFSIEMVGIYMATKDSFLCKKTLWSDGSFTRIPKHFDKRFTATNFGELKQLAAPLVWNDSCISRLGSVSLKVAHESVPVYFFVDFTFVDDSSLVPANQKFCIQSVTNPEGDKYFLITGNSQIVSYPGMPLLLEFALDSCGV